MHPLRKNEIINNSKIQFFLKNELLGRYKIPIHCYLAPLSFCLPDILCQLPSLLSSVFRICETSQPVQNQAFSLLKQNNSSQVCGKIELSKNNSPYPPERSCALYFSSQTKRQIKSYTEFGISSRKR